MNTPASPRSLGELLRVRRDTAGLSQGALAERLKGVRGVTQGKISYWERDIYHPEPSQLGAIKKLIFQPGDSELALDLARLCPPSGQTSSEAA